MTIPSASSGIAFKTLGVLGVIVAIYTGFVTGFDFDIGFSFSVLIVFSGILLSLILFALGSILNAIRENQCDKSSK